VHNVNIKDESDVPAVVR